MKARFHVPLRVAAVSGSMALVAMMAAAPAVAAEGDVDVVNTETVSIYTDPSGEVEKKRIYEQISATGEGTVELRNPAQTEGMRNLDGFGGFDTEDGQQVATLEVDGKERLRTVSEYDGDLPLDIQVQYYLDGELIDPEDVVGKSGHLEVKYRVKNVTAAPQELTYDDGTGNMVTETVDVPIPMVGSLTLVAPSNFTEVTSGEANLAGDGKGGTKLSFTMTLFPPIGSDTAEFGYEAEISDGVIPRATVTALPVNPLESPSFKAAGESYKGGAETGIELTDGASQIDANLLKLRDGAGELLAGLIQLRDGANQLEAGLAGEAAPGADRLAAGAAELNSGLGQIDDGAGQLAAGAGEAAAGGSQLADGAGRLSGGLNQADAGVGDLSAGAKRLAAGQKGLEAGLTQLYDAVDALPQSVQKKLNDNADYVALTGALKGLVLATGGPDNLINPLSGDPTLYGGLKQVKEGLRVDGTDDCIKALAGVEPTNCGVGDAVELLADNFLASITDEPRPELGGASFSDLEMLLIAANGSYDYVVATTGGACPPRAAGLLTLPPLPALNSTVAGGACLAAASAAYGYGAAPGSPEPFDQGGVIARSTAAAGALNKTKLGIDDELVPGVQALMFGVNNPSKTPENCDRNPYDDADKSDNCGINEVLTILEGGVPVLVSELVKSIEAEILAGLGKPTKGCDPESTLRCAAGALADGGEELVAGVNALVSGVNQLAAGGVELSAGAGQLADGLGALQTGAGQLADGTGQAADGSTQLADGANQLATGLGDAASGSGRLADGLKQAAKGAPKLEDGAQRLSDEGTSKLVEAGEATAQNYGQMYASLEAGAERAQTEKMVYGAPEGAMGLAAYSYEIGGEDGESGRNLARGLGGAAVLAAGAGAFALRRRFI